MSVIADTWSIWEVRWDRVVCCHVGIFGSRQASNFSIEIEHIFQVTSVATAIEFRGNIVVVKSAFECGL